MAGPSSKFGAVRNVVPGSVSETGEPGGHRMDEGRILGERSLPVFIDALGVGTRDCKTVEDDRSPRRCRDGSGGREIPPGFGLRQSSDALEVKRASRTGAENTSAQALLFVGCHRHGHAPLQSGRRRPQSRTLSRLLTRWVGSSGGREGRMTSAVLGNRSAELIAMFPRGRAQ